MLNTSGSGGSFFFHLQIALYWEMDRTGFSEQTPLLGEIVLGDIGGRYTGSVSQNKQLLYRGQSCPDETAPHTYIT